MGNADPLHNVVHLPVPRRPEAPHPTTTERSPTRVSRLHVVMWPVIGAAITALGMVAIRGGAAPQRPAVAAVAPTLTIAAQHTPLASIPSTPPSPVRAVQPPEPLPAPASLPAPAPAPSAEEEALASEWVQGTDTDLVYAAPERPRDWYAAMNLCRGRTHAGLTGWVTPSSRQLHALAKDHVLPEAPLWSRTRSARSTDLAFVVHGKAGTLESTEKSAKVSAAVCVRPRATTPEEP